MGSFSGTCEIVEAEDELNSTQHSRRIYGSKSGYSVGDKDALKLKGKMSLEDDINQLFEGIGHKNSPKWSFSSQEGMSPLRKNALKRSITMGMPQSPRVGNSESVSLKQALRDLCISKASEMAATKRLSKSSVPSGVSEAGRIKSLYKTVVVEAKKSVSLVEEGKRRMPEISMVHEETRSNPEKLSQHQVPGIKSSNRSSDAVSEPIDCQVSASSSSPQHGVAIAENVTRTAPKQTEIVSASNNVVSQTLMMEPAHEERCSPPSTPPCSESGGKRMEVNEKVPDSTKLANKASTPKSSSSVIGFRVSKLKRSSPRSAKSVLRNRAFVKKKIQESTSVASNNKGKINLDPSAGELICQRCRCNIQDGIKEPDQVTPASNSTELTSRDVKSSCNNDGTVTPEVKKPKSREKGEFSHSSKSSAGGEFSTSTSISDESNLSVSSCGNRPHMSKDVRWEAIRHVRMQHGVLDLNHFNLLKKLGCGDIGTVYLAELIGTNCLFAIKVMDNEYLAKRKKMPRAQTEREILGMLDHPFLPTLYAQFTTDNLSCLVMEYCPGGDLHVLRQKQPDRNYSEHAARFYVAEVLLALEYLHMLGVVYRDLKPENILVREDGHIMLTDFDLSLRCSVNPILIKSPSFNPDPARPPRPCAATASCIEPSCQVPCFSPQFLSASTKAKKIKADLASQRRSLPQLVAEPTDARSNSFVGTHEYLAPEIIKGEGHGAAVDWWTFGIFLYELLYGITPFKGCVNEETLTNVVLHNLRFPDSPIVSFQARDLVGRLLVKEPEYRLGSEKGAAEIKQHPFFNGLNWALIRCASPPELPEVYDFGPPPNVVSGDTETKYLECKANGEHLEFELF